MKGIALCFVGTEFAIIGTFKLLVLFGGAAELFLLSTLSLVIATAVGVLLASRRYAEGLSIITAVILMTFVIIAMVTPGVSANVLVNNLWSSFWWSLLIGGVLWAVGEGIVLLFVRREKKKGDIELL